MTVEVGAERVRAAAAQRLRPKLDYATAHQRLADCHVLGALTQSTLDYAILLESPTDLAPAALDEGLENQSPYFAFK